jgi:hypothetical protein
MNRNKKLRKIHLDSYKKNFVWPKDIGNLQKRTEN